MFGQFDVHASDFKKSKYSSFLGKHFYSDKRLGGIERISIDEVTRGGEPQCGEKTLNLQDVSRGLDYMRGRADGADVGTDCPGLCRRRRG